MGDEEAIAYMGISDGRRAAHSYRANPVTIVYSDEEAAGILFVMRLNPGQYFSQTLVTLVERVGRARTRGLYVAGYIRGYQVVSAE